MAHLRAIIALIAMLLIQLPAAAADWHVNAVFEGPSIDVLPYLQAVDTDKRAVSVELPSDSAEGRVLMQLNAIGAERSHRWALLTLTNPSDAEQSLVIVLPLQGFTGSGVIWPKPLGSHVQNVTVAGPAVTKPVPALDSDALELRLPPASMTTFAFELTPLGLEEMTLWKRTAFDAREASASFFRGVLLGIAMLMAITILSLYVVRPLPLFPAAALFALASTGFIAFESGSLSNLGALLPTGLRSGAQVRAVLESLMLSGLLLTLLGFADLRRRWPTLNAVVLVLSGLSLALAVYGLFAPSHAAGLARIAFGAAVAGGLVLLVTQSRQDSSRARASLLPWSLLLLWTLTAGLAVLRPGDQDAWSPIVLAGLVLVLVVLAFTLIRIAFAQSPGLSRSSEELGRRALALAGSQQYVWDWRVDDQTLHVGEDLERALLLQPGTLADGSPEAWLDLIHPGDRKAYMAAVQSAERRGHGPFSLEFRLRRGDGAYRWFLLRARAMQGSGRRPFRCIGTLADVTVTRRAQDQLLTDAVYDRVTGLPNRALLIDRLDRAISAIENGKASELHVLTVDLDRFTNFNDGLGYETGDGLLNITGRRLVAIAAPEDTVARMPGDQFAILFSNARGGRDIVAFTDQVRKAVSRPITVRTQEVFLTGSVGVAAYREKGQKAEDLINDAAIALYEAKRRGKDTVEFFRTSMRDDRSELVALESELRRALERNEIEVVYQPVARLADMDLAGFEALIRWRHRSLGLLGPETFLRVAETTGIIRDLGRFVLNESVRNLGFWQRAFRAREPLFVAVNISSSQLLGTELIDEIKAVMTREGVQPETLKIEITESMVMQNPERSVQVLDRLKQMGVGLACDDFGTGYSSLSNLRRLPFDTLKVDRSFLEPEPDDDRASIILETVVLLAHELGLAVVAEGIQSQDHVDRLGELDCDMGQGNFIGAPIAAKQLIDALTGLVPPAGRGKSVIAALWERVARAAEASAISEPEEQSPQEPEPSLYEKPRPADRRDLSVREPVTAADPAVPRGHMITPPKRLAAVQRPAERPAWAAKPPVPASETESAPAPLEAPADGTGSKDEPAVPGGSAPKRPPLGTAPKAPRRTAQNAQPAMEESDGPAVEQLGPMEEIAAPAERTNGTGEPKDDATSVGPVIVTAETEVSPQDETEATAEVAEPGDRNGGEEHERSSFPEDTSAKPGAGQLRRKLRRKGRPGKAAPGPN
ncbi:MAG: EAL domain-containing protein [Hyphomicrobiales bacterium]